jgi:hypothetical protein
MFSPEEWGEVWTWRRTEGSIKDDDPLCELVIEKLEPYYEAMLKQVEAGVIPEEYISFMMTALSMIEEIETMRAMRKLK